MRLLKNFASAALHLPGNIQIHNNEPMVLWLGLWIVVVSTEILSPYPALVLLQAVPAVLATTTQQSDKTLNWPRYIIASAAAPALALIMAFGGSLAGVLIASFLAIGTITRSLLTPPEHTPASAPAQEQGPDMSREAQSLRRMRSAIGQIVELGPTIGHLNGKPIPEWFVDERGRRHDFQRAWTGHGKVHLEQGESLVHPGLIYGEISEPGAGES